MQNADRKARIADYMRKRRITKADDQEIINYVNQVGKNWAKIAKLLDKTPKACKERWENYLDPNIKFTPFTKKDDDLLIEKFNEYGPKWNIIAEYFPGRTAIQLKNRYNSIHKRNKNRMSRAERNKSKSIFTDEEDKLILQLYEELSIGKQGVRCWKALADEFNATMKERHPDFQPKTTQQLNTRYNMVLKNSNPQIPNDQTVTTSTDENSIFTKIDQAIDQANDYNETQDNDLDLNDPDWNSFDDHFGGFDYF